MTPSADETLSHKDIISSHSKQTWKPSAYVQGSMQEKELQLATAAHQYSLTDSKTH